MVKTLIYNCCCLVINYFVGNQKVIFEKQLCLEDLLEQQHLQDPVINMEGLVLLNARRTLMMLSRYFMKKDPPRPVSRHLSAPSIQFNTTKS
jgi:hypothetical protein